VADRSTLTLVYGTRDTKENEAVVLRQYLLQKRARPTAGWDAPTKLLVMIAVVAAAHHDGVAAASGVQLLAAPLLTSDEIAEARSVLMANGQLRAVSGGWTLTARAQKQVRQLPTQRTPDVASA
jgi:alkylhydroperoxidase/carboxymuconolactone decarboxylase family protein YurZ